MAARRALPGLIWLAGCTGAPIQGDSGDAFSVSAVDPEDGLRTVDPSIVPQIFLTAEVTLDSCPGVRLDAVDDQGQLLYPVDVEIDVVDDGRRFRIEPAEPLAVGAWFGVSVWDGVVPCVDIDGRGIEAFHSRFMVRDIAR